MGVNKDSYLILDTLPSEYDSRVKAMEVDTRPTEQYSDIGGLDKQIQELVEAVVLPMTHKDRWGSGLSLSWTCINVQVRQPGHQAAQGCSHVRASRHW